MPPPPETPASARPGKPLHPEVRTAAERHFGWDFTGVRIHDDPDSAEQVRRAGARAVTTGEDIAVAGPAGDIGAGTNRELLHHELAHVVQQNRAKRRAKPGGLAERLSSGGPAPQPAPVVTAVNAGAELGAGKSMNVTATAAGKGALTWTLVGAPAGITIAPRGRRGATIRSAATPLGTAPAGGGTNFQAQAALTSTPGDSAVSGNILFVSVNAIAVAANPAMISVPFFGGNVQAPPANILDPNRDGLTGNTGTVTVTTAPAGRPVTITLPVATGATVAGTVITPAAKTGPIRVRAQDNATSTFNEVPNRIDSMPTKVTGLGPAAAPTAGNYGSQNPIRFGQTDNTVPSTRVIGETITAGGSDAFGITAGVNAAAGGPNPAPIPALSAPANGWFDQLLTGQAGVDVNQFTGKNPPGGPLPAVWQLRQGFHAFGWDGVRAPVEFDNGFHIRSLIRVGANFFFRTEHRFPGASLVAPLNPYAAVNPLITFTGIAGAANTPAAAGGIAADGVATGNATVVSSVAGRTVIWSIVSGPIAVPNTPIAVATPAVVQAGLVAGNFPVKVVDQAFPNREGTGNIRIVPVRLSGLAAAPPSPVAAGTLTTNLTLNAAP
ncbi:MAG TPA: DUF4157 domain-containing protein, partial [Propionibacteriaceae bacterium]|nr:DUF4157 domain-containing protein [Propionibacteriaceae bacterium]